MDLFTRILGSKIKLINSINHVEIISTIRAGSRITQDPIIHANWVPILEPLIIHVEALRTTLAIKNGGMLKRSSVVRSSPCSLESGNSRSDRN